MVLNSENKIWNLGQYNDKIALIDESGVELTYASLGIMSDELIRAIGHRCLVFVLCTNEIGSVVGYTAFINSGIVPAMLSNRIDESMLWNLIHTYEPEYIWAPIAQLQKFSDYPVIHEAYGYVLIRMEIKKQYPLYENLGMLITTSGSTGSPKLVRQSYINVLDNAQSIAEYLELDDSERPITTLPMNYVYGLSIINSHFLVGATLLLTDKGLMQKEFWDFFRNAEATSFGGVPYTYEMLDKLRFYRMNLPSLRTMTQAGGKITPELHEKFAKYAEENGKRFIVMYGASEATSRMGYLPADKAVEKKGSMGIPIPGGKFRIVGDDGTEVTEPFTAGELVYEGRNVTLGYAECGADLIKGDERHGILETGDIAQFDTDGYYYIVGRKKRFLKIFGNRVNLDEVDRLIKAEFNIEIASAGVDDHLYIFITEKGSEERVKSFIVDKTKLNPVAFCVIVIDEIPKNDSGKIQYQELTKLVGE